ncbi:MULTISPECIES: helix-turn-helix domain-containing protein [unclassified Streptomyces]|uniref:helix-turn-helix domain-containing protein n=1 Tax=unclassified Streptomyces TaxID=2593676 RepID=UPI002E28CCD4|nr:helix-turn-helix transcriptional regulator [Streptomyces sp. NBC_00223]
MTKPTRNPQSGQCGHDHATPRPNPAAQAPPEPEAGTRAREKAGLTKRDMAARIGISEQLRGEIESGWRSATPANLIRIADALNCPLVALERKRAAVPPSCQHAGVRPW